MSLIDGESYRMVGGVMHHVSYILENGRRKQISTPVDVRSLGVFQAQRSLKSSESFFHARADQESGDLAAQRSRARRAELLEKQVHSMVDSMRQPPKAPSFKTISDESFLQLMRSAETWDLEGFSPIGSYYHKIKGIRPPWKGEVGVVCTPGTDHLLYYLILENGYEKVHPVVAKYIPDDLVVTALKSKYGVEEFAAADEPEPSSTTQLVAYVCRTSEGPALIFSMDENEALDTAIESGFETPERASVLDKCVSHAMAQEGSDTLICTTCLASYKMPPPPSVAAKSEGVGSVDEPH